MATKDLQPQPQSSRDPARLLPEEIKDTVIELAARGLKPPQIAKKVFPKDAKKRGALRRKLWKIAHADVDFQRRVAARAQAELVYDLPAMMNALGRRAKTTGKPDAVKLAAEMTGFHTPKQQHEHSGEVKIKLDMPRPKAIDGDGEEITDAEVVD